MTLENYKTEVEKFLNGQYPNGGGLLVLKTNLNSRSDVLTHMYSIVRKYYNTGDIKKDVNNARAENQRLMNALIQII